MIKQAVILAAGRGARLTNLTRDRTKAMLPVLGRPIVVRVMDRIREAGVTDFVVVIGAQESSLASYLSSSWYPNINVQYVMQPVPKGTADALMQASSYINDSFILASVDALAPLSHTNRIVDKLEQADMVLSVAHASPAQVSATTEAVIDGDRVVRVTEKPQAVTSDLATVMFHTCSRRLLDYLPHIKTSSRGEKELASAIQALIDDGGMVTFHETRDHLQLTHDADLLAINRWYLDEGRESYILSELPNEVDIIQPVRIDPGVRVESHARIGPYVYLEGGSKIGHGAQVSNAVVLRNGSIGNNEMCEKQIVMRDVRISVED